MFDQDNKGYITEQDIKHVCIAQGIKIDWLEDEDSDKLFKFIHKYDKDRDGKLNYLEFTKAITPKNSAYVQNYNKFSRSYVSEKDQQIRMREWIDELGKVIETAISSEIILETIRNDLQLDGEAIFDMIDNYSMSYVSSGVFVRWVSDNCGYRITEDEVTYILNRYDKDNDYRIKKEEFISEVQPLHSNDEQYSQEQEFEEKEEEIMS